MAPQQQSQAQRLVQHARKRVCRIDRNRRQQRIYFALKVAARKLAGVLGQFVPLQKANALLAQLRQQLLVPAVVLRGHKAVNLGGQGLKRFVWPQAVVARLAVAILNSLHQAGLPDLDILIQVRACDRQKLYALQQRVGRILRLFKHTPIELHPGVVPSVEKLCFLCISGHSPFSTAVFEVYAVLAVPRYSSLAIPSYIVPVIDVPPHSSQIQPAVAVRCSAFSQHAMHTRYGPQELLNAEEKHLNRPRVAARCFGSDRGRGIPKANDCPHYDGRALCCRADVMAASWRSTHVATGDTEGSLLTRSHGAFGSRFGSVNLSQRNSGSPTPLAYPSWPQQTAYQSWD